MHFYCQSLYVSPSLSIVWFFDGGGCVQGGDQWGLTLSGETRMDLSAISVVGCCANLPATNGTAVHSRSTSWYRSKALNQQQLTLSVTRVENLSFGIASRDVRHNKRFHTKMGIVRRWGDEVMSKFKKKIHSKILNPLIKKSKPLAHFPLYKSASLLSVLCPALRRLSPSLTQSSNHARFLPWSTLRSKRTWWGSKKRERR